MRLETADIEERLSEMTEWRLEDKSIAKKFSVEGLIKASEFAREIAYVAENMNHNPDIFLSSSHVKFVLTTREEGGVTEKDFELAGKIDQIYTKITRIEEPSDEGDYGMTEESADDFGDYDSDGDGDGDGD